MPVRRNERIDDDDNGDPLPPHGQNYRRTRRRTNYYQRATASVAVADSRFADQLVAMSSSWLSLMINSIMMTAQFILLVAQTPNNDSGKAQFDAHLQNAMSSFSIASHCD